jgi:hypothetical protein
MSSYATKTVSFNVHGVLYSDTDEMGPVEEEIRDLASGLQLVKDEQAYLVVRERVHRNTCESTVSIRAGVGCVSLPSEGLSHAEYWLSPSRAQLSGCTA